MPDPIPADTSPTGTPFVPPSVFRWIALIVVLGLAVLGVLAAEYPEAKAFPVAIQILAAVAAVLGIASPGLRKTVAVLLCVGFASVSLSGCHLTDVQRDKLMREVVDCASAAARPEIGGWVQDASAALAGSSTQAQADDALGRLVAAGGRLAICGIGIALERLEAAMVAGGPGEGGSELVPPILRVQHGARFLDRSWDVRMAVKASAGAAKPAP